MVYIANNRFYRADRDNNDEILDAISQLTLLARRALEIPTEGQLKTAMQRDPYCQAAYAYGYREGYDSGSEAADIDCGERV